MSTESSYAGDAQVLVASAFQLTERVRQYAAGTDRRPFTVQIGPQDLPDSTETSSNDPTVAIARCEIIFIDEPGITAAEQAEDFEPEDGGMNCTSTGADEVTCALEE